jgi:NAD(P)-dependent dehydrogenase (short-subunit alcohol dehydrogenase family)
MEKKTVVVTGGAKGIGAASCRLFAAKGWKVAILDIDESEGENLAGELGEGAIFIKSDVSREVEVRNAFHRIISDFGEISVLVHSAGIQRYSRVTETSEEEWDEMMNVTVKSAFLCSKYAIPSMQKSGKGFIALVSSVQAFISQTNVAPYTTAKTALLGLTRSIAVDYGPQVRCVAICPGTVDTPMFRSSIELSPDPQEVYDECVDMHLVKRIGQPDEVAELIYFLSGDKASFITGQPIRIDGGLGVSIGGSKRD